MAIVNLTPDSFSDGGRFDSPGAAADRALHLADEGADLLDLGGESTRPGAQRVSARDQLARVIPAIEAIRAIQQLRDLPISIDTTRAEVARIALQSGADVINDVSGGIEDPEMLPLAADQDCGIILMHRLKAPDRDQYSDQYKTEPVYPQGVTRSVASALASARDRAVRAGCGTDSIVLDPGLGFGKSVEQNLDLIRNTPELLLLGQPILSGISRKSFVGRVSSPDKAQTEPLDRGPGSIALSVLHLTAGARLFRVHDVAATRQALDAAWALIERGGIEPRMLLGAAESDSASRDPSRVPGQREV